jgi:F-type H+-transporting ATPase subunit b
MDKILEIFGLHWQSILLSVLNFALLAVGMYFLLFKPVQKMMNARREKLDAIYVENETLNKEAADIRRQQEEWLAEANKRVNAMMADAAKNTEKNRAAIIDDAKKQAAEIIKSTKTELRAEKTRLEEYFKAHVVELAVEMASKVLSREVAAEDNKKIIDDCLSKWS